MKKIAQAVQLIGAGSLILVAGQVYASGYHFGVQSVSSQAMANSNAAEATDASVIFYNPAGLTYLKGNNLTGGLIVVDPHIEASNVHATNAIGLTITGNDGGNPTEPVVVPEMYYAHQINDRAYVGVGMFVPFGDATKYDPQWAGRYNGIDLDLKTVAINPQFAYKVTDQLSLGAGVSAQYMKAKYSKAADLGSIVAQKVLPAFIAANPGLAPYAGKIAASLISNTNYDGTLEYNGDGWAAGFNFGALYQYDDTLRFGAAYRSSISEHLSGDATWKVQSFSNPTLAAVSPAANAAFATLAGNAMTATGFTTGGGTVDVDTPDSLAVNFFKQINDKVAVTGDWTHTWHSKFQSLDLKFSNGKLEDAVIKQNWRNTDRVSFGLSYQYSTPLKLRFGIAYDQSPADDDRFRIANLPDNNRIWFSTGFNYAFNKDMSVDFAYTYVHIQGASMNNTECLIGSGCLGSGTTTSADFKSYAQIAGIQMNYRF
ncbi:OmpP1/FadL family transporter [Andreprevotia chitinilytica]|uniref:OmpP1/FadL family transporter n=1 Tax=Andreprevotia chitinilytica TaxID=396808 RepID=UPI00054F1BB5|nr:OmpP1/FadL family transporter [Andreprevotia chitinilytica]